MKKTWMRGISGFLTLAMCVSLLTCGASAVNGYNVEVSGKDTVAVGGTTTLTAVPEEIGQIGSWTTGGTDASTLAGDDYAYDPALYVTADGVQEQLSTSSRISAGSYDDSSATGVQIIDSESGHNGILINNAPYTIQNTTISMLTDADGTDTCDFSGKGTAVMAVGENAVVNIENTRIYTSGVATMPVFSDGGATVTIKNSVLSAQGGTLYEEYMNSPDQTTMVAPPWILGIMGTARTTNLEGNDSTMNVIDSRTSSANWAVLSTDSGSNMYLNMYNTSLTLTNAKEDSKLMQAEGGELGETLDNPYTTRYGAGYGTYVIGSAVETFAGATVNVGTYACIFTGGSAVFTGIDEGTAYTLKSATGENDVTYVATATKNSVVNSDTFGFMFHQSANSLTIEDGTVINSKLATFLLKTGSSNEAATISVDNSTLNNGGMLIQIMDNDDATNGGMMAADDEYNTNGGNMNFAPYHTENEGWNTEEASAAETEQNVTLTNGDYSGNVYNASGSDNSQYGPLSGTVLNLTLGEGATLTGAVASTAAIHVTYEGTQALAENGFAAFESEEEAAEFVKAYQNTYYWMNHYYDQGQVANLICDNGANNINVTLTGDAVWTVTGTSVINSLTISSGASVVVPEGVTLTIDGTEYTNCIITYEAVYTDNAVYIDPKGENGINSWTSGGTTAADNDYLYNAALYIDENGEVVADYSSSDRIVENEDGTYTLEDSQSGHNGIMVVNAEYTISGYTIKLLTDADGTDTCDFSGKGTAVAVYGSKANVTIEDSVIETAGVATMPVFSDNGATVTIKNSTLHSDGGTLYQSYMNSPDQTTMVAPPWILGIMGTSRATNLEGNDSTMNVIDSDTSSANWAVLSTDSGSNMYLNMYNTSLTLTNEKEDSKLMQEEGGEFGETLDDPYTENYGAGYGTYVIGSAQEVFAGATVNVGTYACIFTGGDAVFTGIEQGKTYTLESADGETDVEYVATATANSVVNSDTFGFMFHQNTNSLTLEEGTEINSGYTTFLMKTGGSNEAATVTVDGTEINSGNNVLIQLMDNDDSTNGGMMAADDPLNTNGAGMNFIPYHTENEGFAASAKEVDSTEQNFTFTNGDYVGNIYNGSGTDNSQYGPLNASVLNVTIGEGATLTGAAASTATIHVTYEGSQIVKANNGYAYDTVEEAAEVLEKQNTYYAINHYFDQGQVANLILAEDGAPINITLADGGTWTVTGTSVISSLTIGEGSSVEIAEGATLTIDGIEYTAEELVAGTYGTVAEPAESTGNAGGGPGGEGGGPGGEGGEMDPSFSDVGTGGIGSGSDEAASLTFGTVAEPVESTGNAGGAPGGEGGGPGGEGGEIDPSFSDVSTGGIGSGSGEESGSAYTYEWASADETIATVVDNGDGTATVTGVALGEVEISLEMTKNGVYMGKGVIEITVSEQVEELFDDVTDPDVWYFDAVYAVRDAGLMVGVGDNLFKPAEKMTRAEAAVVAVKIAGIDVSAYEGKETVFTDVPESHWGLAYIVAANENGLVSGRGDGTFDPDAKITREEFVTMLVAALGIDSSEFEGVESVFPDVPANSWATAHIVAAYENGLVKGYDNGNFGYGDLITRAEVAAMLANSL